MKQEGLQQTVDDQVIRSLPKRRRVHARRTILITHTLLLKESKIVELRVDCPNIRITNILVSTDS